VSVANYYLKMLDPARWGGANFASFFDGVAIIGDFVYTTSGADRFIFKESKAYSFCLNGIDKNA
jgi:hypothetical protein